MLIGRDSFAELDHDLGHDVGGDLDCGVKEDGLSLTALSSKSASCLDHEALQQQVVASEGLWGLHQQLIIDIIRNRVIHVSTDLDLPDLLGTRLNYDLHPDVTTRSKSTRRSGGERA